MTRPLRAIVVLIFGCCWFFSAAKTAIAESTPSIVQAYEYEGHSDSPS